MGTKATGKCGRWFNEHGIQPEKKTCIECGWFAEGCLKWNKETNPFDLSCYYFQRKSIKSITYSKEDVNEEYAYILEFIRYRRSVDNRPMCLKKPKVQGVGEKNIIFFEMVPKNDDFIKIHDRVYIGDGNSQIIDYDGNFQTIYYVKRRIPYQELTTGARKKFPEIIDKLIVANEKKFVKFFNDSYWITPKLHMLSLLAHVNNSKQERIIREKNKTPFVSLEDIEMRTKVSPIPAIANRILCELINPVKYILFINIDEKEEGGSYRN